MAVASELAASGRSRLSFLLLWAAKPSLAISAGANVVQKLLGHKTAVLTLDRYGHLYDSDVDAVGQAINEVITVTCGQNVGTAAVASRHLHAVNAPDLQ